MSKFFDRFYFFSKLSTSLILFFLLVLLGYFFSKIYLEEYSFFEENNLNIIDNQIIKLENLVVKNSQEIRSIQKLINENNEKLDNISSSISSFEDNFFNESLNIQIEKLINENKILENKTDLISSKLQNLNNLNTGQEKNDRLFILDNYLNLILLKLENGIDFDQEIDFLLNFDLNESKIIYIEKLLLMTKENFVSLSDLKKDFELASSNYLNNYYLEKSNNTFLKYFLDFVSLKPNANKNINDKNIMILNSAKTNLEKGNLEGSLKDISAIENKDFIFGKWIENIKLHIEFKNLIDKIKN